MAAKDKNVTSGSTQLGAIVVQIWGNHTELAPCPVWLPKVTECVSTRSPPTVCVDVHSVVCRDTNDIYDRAVCADGNSGASVVSVMNTIDDRKHIVCVIVHTPKQYTVHNRCNIQYIIHVVIPVIHIIIL